MTPRRAVAGAVGIFVTVALNLSWIALVALAALAAVIWVGKGLLWAVGGG